jgi:hypothetical protein
MLWKNLTKNKTNHENTKGRKHEIFLILFLFRVFHISCFRDKIISINPLNLFLPSTAVGLADTL